MRTNGTTTINGGAVDHTLDGLAWLNNGAVDWLSGDIELANASTTITNASDFNVLIDDSTVRGTTSTKIVQMMRDAGATEVHLRVASPPITHPDFYGIDTPDKRSLLAATHSLEEMREFIGVDSLAFLSIEGLYRAVCQQERDAVRPQYTDHCFTGEYPTALTDMDGVSEHDPRQLSLL